MSQENVEIMRRHYDDFNRGDLDAVLHRIDPDAVWWDRADDPDATVHRGRDAVEKHMEDIEDLAELRIEPQEFVDADDSVVIPVRPTGHGRAGDAPFEAHEVHVVRLRDGRIVEYREYRGKDEALKAVGLEE